MGNRYNAEIVAGALLPVESRTIARLLLERTSDAEINRLITVENVLQKRSPGTAVRKAELIRKRIATVDDGMIRLIAEGGGQSSVQALLVAAMNHSSLIGDFLLRVVKEKWRVFDKRLRPSDWDDFLQECEQIDPVVKQWQPSTRVKLGQVVKKCLVEAGFLASARDPSISEVVLSPEIVEYLTRTKNDDVLDALNIFS